MNPNDPKYDGVYACFNDVPGVYSCGTFKPADGLGTRYLSDSGEIRVYLGHHMARAQRWINERDAPVLGIKPPPNPRAKSSTDSRWTDIPIKPIKRVEVKGRIILGTEPTDGDEQAKFFAARPAGECPCGRMRAGCPWHDPAAQ